MISCLEKPWLAGTEDMSGHGSATDWHMRLHQLFISIFHQRTSGLQNSWGKLAGHLLNKDRVTWESKSKEGQEVTVVPIT